ncbi:MAG: hypothetical protein FWE86_04820, partial [Oscillospiraceae bacterium]|nr:hypothetical protein [Oscillospiraceae bacterium]
GDVLKLAEDGLKSACGNADPARAESDARTAIEAVVARLPGLVEGAQPSENNPAVGYAGSAGNFPRADSMGSMQQELDRARQTGNNAAAVAIISQAAKKGIRLR